MKVNQLRKMALMLFAAVATAYGQQGQWAAVDNPTAKFMIDAERQWAEAACTHNEIAPKILADDFQGTSPDGQRYTKFAEVSDTADRSKKAKDCQLIDAKVRFFGDGLAMVYGSDSSVRQAKDGSEQSRCLIWTDTWLSGTATGKLSQPRIRASNAAACLAVDRSNVVRHSFPSLLIDTQYGERR